jgi:hypothetical protein
LVFRLATVIAQLYGAVHFRQPALTQQWKDSGLTLNIWQRVIKKDTKKALFTRHLPKYQGSEQYASGCALVHIE